jgi:hypothetical protein
MYKQILTALLVIASLNAFSQTINIGERTLQFKDKKKQAAYNGSVVSYHRSAEAC